MPFDPGHRSPRSGLRLSTLLLPLVLAACVRQVPVHSAMDNVADTPQIKGRVVTEGGHAVRRYWLNGELVEHPDGSFQVPLGRSGRERLVFVAEGFASTLRLVDAHGGVSLGEVVLTRGHEIRGLVRNAVTGSPIADALIDVSEKSTAEEYEAALSKEWGAVLSAADGTFVLRVETPAPTLIVTHQRYVQKWVSLERHGQGPLDVAMNPGSTLKGTTSKPELDCAEVRLVRKDGGISRETAIQKGMYELFGIPAGSYFLTVWDTRGPRTGHPVLGPYALEIPGRGTVTHDLR